MTNIPKKEIIKNRVEEKICTVFAWRYMPTELAKWPRQWQIDASLTPYPELEKLWKSIHGQQIEMRRIEVDFAVLERQNKPYRFDTPEWLSQSNPKYKGWWNDPFTRLWVAPDEYISTPHDEPKYSRDIACSFIPHGNSWIDLTLALPTQTATIFLSSVFDPVGDILLWLENVWKENFCRFEIDEEGTNLELHTLPVSKFPKSGRYSTLTAEEQNEWVRLIVVRERRPTLLLLDVAIEKKSLVRSMYTAFLNSQTAHPEIMKNWPYWPHKKAETRESGIVLNKIGPYFCRSPFLDNALVIKPNSIE